MNTISRFETITRHQSKIAQSSVVIRCLTEVLKYIASMLDDDATQTLFELIDDHLDTIGTDAHKLNITMLTDHAIESLYQAFVSKGYYTGEKDAMIAWMLSHPEIYELPQDNYADLNNTAISLIVLLRYIDTNHDKDVAVHANQIKDKLDLLMSNTAYIPCLCITPASVLRMLYKIIGIDAFTKVQAFINSRLALYPPTDPIIDYWTNEDLTEWIYFSNGEVASFLTEYGESGDTRIYRKLMDYYSNHSTFVVSSSMTPEYANTLLTLRNNVNTSYTKVFNVFTVLSKYDFAINCRCTISNFINNKTLDLINLTGLSKSLVSVSLIPYNDGTSDMMRLVVSFDNYNPIFTAIVVDPITLDSNTTIDLIINVTKYIMSVHVTVGDTYHAVSFNNASKMFDIDPHYLFVCPMVAYESPGTIRLSHVHLYNNALNDADIKALIYGFNQRS